MKVSTTGNKKRETSHGKENAIPPTNKNKRKEWLNSFALLGDSGSALAVSFVLLLVSIAFSLSLDDEKDFMAYLAFFKSNYNDPYNRLGPVPSIDPPHIFVLSEDSPKVSETMLDAYLRDGVIAVRGLIDADLMKALDQESRNVVLEHGKSPSARKQKTQFHTVSHGVLFRNSSQEEGSWTPGPFWRLALGSNVSSTAAQLLQAEMTASTGHRLENMRVIRDILLTKDNDEYVCGFHVDDMGFWPACPNSPGVNAWVALDDMPVEYGGGFALAVGSNTAEWRDEAHTVTGASTIFPKDGYMSAKDMLDKRTGSGTCNLEKEAPHLHKRMEETKRIYPVQRGDVIFHTRWLFHRTVAFERSYTAEKSESLIYRRYSIRYGSGDSIIPPGYGTELSVLWNEENGGRTADEVCNRDGPWYPQAWPLPLEKESQEVLDLLQNKMPSADKRRLSRQKEIKTLLKKQTMQKHHRRQNKQTTI